MANIARRALVVATSALSVLGVGYFISSHNVVAPAQAQDNDGYEVKIKPEWTKDGRLKLPKDFREWVFLGAPFTPHALNDGKANFPEFHNVYVQPEAFLAYRQNGKWPVGTIMLKELQLIDDPKSEFKDGSRYEVSGRGYFPGPVNGVDASVKDPKRFPESRGWGYFNFNHGPPPYKAAAAAAPVAECAQCHIDNSHEDMTFIKMYKPILTPLPRAPEAE